MAPNTKSEGPDHLVNNQVVYIKARISTEETHRVNNQGTSRQQEAEPNTKCERPVQLALPYNQAVYMKAGTSVVEEHGTVNDQSTSSQVEVADEEEDEPVLRITTRARTTYELDRFNKNALLIITCHDAPVITSVKETFQRYKFEVTVVKTVLDEIITNEDWEKISQFFQQDFTTTGAVAIVAATSIKCRSRSRSIIDLRNYAHGEYNLMQFVVDNSQLHGKPKIFISEALEDAFYNRLTLTDNVRNLNDIRVEELPVDMLYIKSRILKEKKYSYFRRSKSLELICHALNLMEEGSNVQDVLPNLVTVNRLFVQKSNIEFHSTLRKELVLDRINID